MKGLGQKLLLETPLHSDYIHSHTHKPSPLSHGHPTLHICAPPWLGANGGGRAEGSCKHQPVSFLQFETWALHPHSIVNRSPQVDSQK